MADPISMTGMAAMASMGSTVLGGLLGAKGAGIQAQGQQIGIEGQMLATMGRAFQFDTQAQEFTFKSKEETYLADVSRINQRISKENASYERDRGEVMAGEAGMEARANLGAAKAAQASSGIDIGSGSASRVRESMIEIGSFNQAMIRSNAAKVAYGYEVEATQAEAQAAIHDMQSDLDKMNAQNATTAAGITRQGLPLLQRAYDVAGQAGNVNALGSLVTMGGSIASKWMGGSYQGMFGSPGGATT